jgi:integrase
MDQVSASTQWQALLARLLYGSGLCLPERLRLRIQDMDFGQHLIIVQGGKGSTGRTTLLPRNLRDEWPTYLEAVNALHHQDLEEGSEAVSILSALARQAPKAAREAGWQWEFPARARSMDPRSGREMRHHVQGSGLQQAVKRAAQQAGLDKLEKKVGCHTLRHSFTTHPLPPTSAFDIHSRFAHF